MNDPEVRQLQIETARAYAVAERLASELDETVEDLLAHVGRRGTKKSSSVTGGNQPATVRRRK